MNLVLSETNRQYFMDLAERVAGTYFATLLGLVTADGFGLLNMSDWKAAALAGLPAAYSAVKGGVAKFVGSRATASILRRKV